MKVDVRFRWSFTIQITTSPCGIQFGKFYIKQFYAHGPKGAFESPYQRMRWKRDFMLGRTWICSEIPSFSASQFNRKDTILRLRTLCIRLAICQVNKGLDVNLLFQTFWLTNIYRTMPQKPKTYRDENQQTYFVKNIPLYLTKKIFHNTQVRFNPVHDSKPQSPFSPQNTTGSSHESHCPIYLCSQLV